MGSIRYVGTKCLVWFSTHLEAQRTTLHDILVADVALRVGLAVQPYGLDVLVVLASGRSLNGKGLPFR